MAINDIPTFTGTAPVIGQEQSEFNQNVQDELTYMNQLAVSVNTFAGEANTLASEVNANAAAASKSADNAKKSEDVAIGSANYKGAWSNLTGPLSVPASVSHENSIWLLNSDLNNVAASEPSRTNSDWSFIQGALQSAFQSEQEHEIQREANKQARNYNSGFDEWGNHRSLGSQVVNQGLWNYAPPTASNALYLGKAVSSIGGTSKTNHPMTCIAGVVSTVLGINTGDLSLSNKLSQIPAPDGRDTFNRATGVATRHADVATAFAAAGASDDVEVITHPTDLNLFEHWKENDNAEYFPEGAPQTGLTGAWNGFTLVDSIRPASYFQVFDGQYVDPDSVGTAVLRETGATVQLPKCIKLATLTFAQSARLSALVGMGMYQNEDGFWQNRYAHKSYRFGNGKFDNVRANDGDLKYSPALAVLSRNGNAYVQDPYNGGIYTDGAECYAQVLGTIPRLNTGVKSQQHNNFGTRKASDNKFWYNTTVTINSMQDCFDPAKYLANSGSIVSNNSGHPDGLFFDAMYASGLNGWVDERLSVTEDSDHATDRRQSADMNGNTRGREDLVFTKVVQSTLVNNTSNAFFNLNDTDKPEGLDVGDSVWVKRSGENVYTERNIVALRPNAIELNDLTSKDANNAIIVMETETNIEVSDEFSTSMVIGNPTNIVQVNALKGGWYGTWCPVIPGSSATLPFTRKSIVTTSQGVNTGDNGITWAGSSPAISPVTNDSTFGSHNSPGRVGIYPYTAHTKHTDPVTDPVVYNDRLGNYVEVTASYTVERGCLLAETLIGEILKSNSLDQSNSYPFLSKYVVPGLGLLDRAKYNPIDIPAPNNNSAALVTAFATTIVNGLRYPLYYPKMINHSGSSWVDDGLIDISAPHIGKDPIGFEPK